MDTFAPLPTRPLLRAGPFRRLAAVSLCAALLSLLGAALPHAARAVSTLEVTPTRFQPGDLVWLTVSGFTPGGYEATIRVDGEDVETFFIPPGGSTSVIWPTPSDLAIGAHDLLLCASCDQGDLDQRSNAVRITVTRGTLDGAEVNLQVWGVEITQAVRGDFARRVPPLGPSALPDESIVHVANRRTVVRVYPWMESGPDRSLAYGGVANLVIHRDGNIIGPVRSLNTLSFVRSDATLAELRSDMSRTFNFILPPEALELDAADTTGSFELSVTINTPDFDQIDECSTCYSDNTASQSANEFRHVGRDGNYALKLRPHLVQAEVEQPDESVVLVPRPTAEQVTGAIGGLFDVMPLADGERGVRVLPSIDVDWSGTQEGWDPIQTPFLIENYLPGGVLSPAEPNDFYAFLYWGGEGCAGHAYLDTPFLRSSACVPNERVRADYVLAHELSHAIGQAHAGNGHGEAEGGGYDPAYPGAHGQVEPDSWGMDVYDVRLIPPQGIPDEDNPEGTRHDYMSYGQHEWVSRYVWDRTAAMLRTPTVQVGRMAIPPLLARAGGGETQAGFPEVGFVARIEPGGSVSPLPFVVSGVGPPRQGDGTWQLEFLGINGQLLGTHFPVPFLPQDIHASSLGEFSEGILLPDGWRTVRLLRLGVPVWSRTRSANPPLVTLVTPADGFQWPAGQTVVVSWQAADIDNDPLSFRLLGFHNASNELFVLAAGLKGTQTTIDPARLPDGGQWQLFLEVTDGSDAVFSNLVNVWLPPRLPGVTIVKPEPGAVYVAGAVVPAIGLAGGLVPVPEGNASWYLDGLHVGDGFALDLGDVPVGAHDLELRVLSMDQLLNKAEVSFSVVSSLQAPQPLAPADGSIQQHSPVTLEWSEIPGASGYRMRAATQDDFDPIAQEIGNIPVARARVIPAAGTQALYWQVRAENAVAPSPWSPTFSFQVAAGVAVPAPGAVRQTLSARPNPLRGATRIAFALPAGGPLRLDVYDLSGRRVRQLVEGRREAGAHEAWWDGTDERGRAVGAGVYVVRLETPRGTTSLRVALLR